MADRIIPKSEKEPAEIPSNAELLFQAFEGGGVKKLQEALEDLAKRKE